MVLCVRGIEERLTEGGESRRPAKGKKEVSAAMEERAVRVLGSASNT
jgi:hypothetical protein